MKSDRKRLIELSLPLKTVSAQSTREKSIRHSHISTLRIWWARYVRTTTMDRGTLWTS